MLGEAFKENADIGPSVGKAIKEGGFYVFLLGTLDRIVQVTRRIGFAVVDGWGDDPPCDAQDRGARPHAS